MSLTVASLVLGGCTDQTKNYPDNTLDKKNASFKIIQPQLALVEISELGQLAKQLDKELLVRAGAVQELRAAQARLKAAEFERLPKFFPTASYSLEGGETSVGLGVEQTVLDFGATKAKIESANLDIQEKRLNLWVDRNQTVFDGLSAFLDITHITNRLRVYQSLEGELENINILVSARSSGGVADRGENLRVLSAQQEVQRKVIESNSELSEAKSQLTRLMIPISDIPKVSTLDKIDTMCRRNSRLGSFPEVALAEINHAKAKANLRSAHSRRFPKIVLNAALNRVLPGVTNSPTAGINLDSSNLLGLGRKQTILAAESDLDGARLTLDRTRENTQAELRQYEIEYQGLQASKRTLKSLIGSKNETISLYREQIEAGAMELPEGISFLQELADTQLLMLDVEADIIKNCLILALKRGALAQIELVDV
jgi:adhesin transport system outer membrane protein